MIIDSQELFSYGQNPTATGDTASTNVLDTGSQSDDGVGYTPYLTVTCTTTATSGGAATVQAVLQTSVDNVTFTDVVAGAAVPVANVTAKAVLLQTRLPIGLKRYLRVVYRIGTAALTAGAFNAFVSMNIDKNITYPSNFVVG